MPKTVESEDMVVVMFTLPLPSKEVEPVTSPDSCIVLAVAKVVAVSALPVRSPVTLPVILPVTLPVTLPVIFPVISPVKVLDAVMLTPIVIHALLAAFLIFSKLLPVSTQS